MAANISQIFSVVGNIGGVASGLGANTAMDGTGTTALVFTAGSNGSRIERVQAIHLGTNVAGLLRFFWNNGSTPATATNNSLIEELAMAANTLVQNAISVPGILLRVPIVLAPNQRLYAAVAVSVASGYQITAFGGSY